MQFIRLLAKAHYVISDGGSNQEECHYLGKPCLLLRSESERREGLGGSCVLSHFNMDLVEQFLKSPQSWSRPPSWPLQSPSRLICDSLERR